VPSSLQLPSFLAFLPFAVSFELPRYELLD